MADTVIAKARELCTASELALVSASRSKQRAAAAAAKRDRLKRSGIQTRIRGHVSARGKRSQSRRDHRG